MLALAGIAAMIQRGHDGKGPEDAGEGIGERVLERNRCAALVAHQTVETCHRREAQAIGSDVFERSVEAGGRHRTQDDVWLRRAQLRVAQAEPLHHTRAEVLDDDVGVRDEIEREIPRLLLFQVQRDRTISRPAGVIGKAAIGIDLALRERRQLARHVDAFTRLDLEHLGTEKRERLPRHGSRPDPAEIHHPDTRERQLPVGCGGPLTRLAHGAQTTPPARSAATSEAGRLSSPP